MYLKNFFPIGRHVRAQEKVTFSHYLIIENTNFQSLISELITEILHKNYSMKIAFMSDLSPLAIWRICISLHVVCFRESEGYVFVLFRSI